MYTTPGKAHLTVVVILEDVDVSSDLRDLFLVDLHVISESESDGSITAASLSGSALQPA
jgi:hypothetical protein